MSITLKNLESRKQELENELKLLHQASKPVDLGESIGRLTRMDAIQHQQMALNSKKQVELSIELVNDAIKRFNENEYGVCLKCEEEISEKRLLAKPEAAFCLDCQQK